MKKYLYGGILLLLNIYPVCAQSDINQVLESIALNNKTLKAGGYLTEAQKLEAKTGKYLANPTIEFNQLWGDKKRGVTSMKWLSYKLLIFPVYMLIKTK